LPQCGRDVFFLFLLLSIHNNWFWERFFHTLWNLINFLVGHWLWRFQLNYNLNFVFLFRSFRKSLELFLLFITYCNYFNPIKKIPSISIVSLLLPTTYHKICRKAKFVKISTSVPYMNHSEKTPLFCHFFKNFPIVDEPQNLNGSINEFRALICWKVVFTKSFDLLFFRTHWRQHDVRNGMILLIKGRIDKHFRSQIRKFPVLKVTI
jgi:hypothetical protein